MAPKNQVTVYSQPDCCLCNEVKEQLRRLRKSRAFDWEDVNILEDRDAFEKFKEEIPVVFVNGRRAFRYHLDERKFLKLLL